MNVFLCEPNNMLLACTYPKRKKKREKEVPKDVLYIFCCVLFFFCFLIRRFQLLVFRFFFSFFGFSSTATQKKKEKRMENRKCNKYKNILYGCLKYVFGTFLIHSEPVYVHAKIWIHMWSSTTHTKMLFLR